MAKSRTSHKSRKTSKRRCSRGVLKVNGVRSPGNRCKRKSGRKSKKSSKRRCSRKSKKSSKRKCSRKSKKSSKRRCSRGVLKINGVRSPGNRCKLKPGRKSGSSNSSVSESKFLHDSKVKLLQMLPKIQNENIRNYVKDTLVKIDKKQELHMRSLPILMH